MIHEFILASGNPHKVEEFEELLNKEVFLISHAPEKLEVEETGETFNQNALLKAEAYYNKFGKAVVSDDSGIVVSAIPEELGVYSARFGGDGLDDKQRAELLLKRLEGLSDEHRKAYFVCVLCFYLGPKEIFFFEGRMPGRISENYLGEGGFGYDPVFIPDNHPGTETIAMLEKWKKKNSHRSQACEQASQFFQNQ